MDRNLVGTIGRMRVLHVGWGFWPWRVGGLIHYAEDLMAAQVERGDDVAYFFAGRQYPWRTGTRLKRWRRGGVAMHEVVNSPIVSGLELGTGDPDLDLAEPWIEERFASVLRSFQPDVVHFQELLCLPSSLIDVADGVGIPTVMTLQDYFPLCSTLRLFDVERRHCTRLEVGEDCAVRNAGAPRSRTPMVDDTLKFEAATLRRRVRLHRWPSRRPFEAVVWRVYKRGMRRVENERPSAADQSPAAYQRRRDVNVERLGRVGALIAQSPRVAEIYAQRGVSDERLRSLRFTLSHIERLRPRSISAPPDPITFTTLGGCASRTKGAHVIVGALRELRARGLEARFRLRVYGGVHDEVRGELEGYQGVEIPEMYTRDRLDSLLDAVDVGIMPSIWEEAFGYTGLEMLAKGIPLIANPLGGIVEYAREGQTAWLNAPCTGEGLAELMAALIAQPRQVVEMHRRVLAAREELIRPFSEHVEAMNAIYREASGALAVPEPLP